MAVLDAFSKVQDFGALLREPAQSHSCGEDIEITILHILQHCPRHSCPTRKSIDLLKSIWTCWWMCRRTKLHVFKALIMHFFLYRSETWTLSCLGLVLMPLQQVLPPYCCVQLPESCVQPTVSSWDQCRTCYLYKSASTDTWLDRWGQFCPPGRLFRFIVRN